MYEINRKHGLYWGLTAATALVCTFLCHAEDASTDTSSPMRQMRSAAKQENEPNVLTGWADAMQNRQIRQIRFIRMQHAGTDWDAGMNDDTRADINLLEQLGTLTGLKVAQRGEAHAIRELARYPRGREPPFVYMTGTGEIGVSNEDVHIMRRYLLGGGMLIGDSRSPAWTTNFMTFAQAVLPDKALVELPADDSLFQTPYPLTQGAPSLPGHGSDRAIGIKHRERWVIVFHPGGLGNAWQVGHSGLDPDTVEAAYRFGINLICHAFKHSEPRM